MTDTPQTGKDLARKVLEETPFESAPEPDAGSPPSGPPPPKSGGGGGSGSDAPDDPHLLYCAQQNATDIGNGRRLLKRTGDHILSVVGVGWHVYDGTRFKEDQGQAGIRKLAQQVAEKIYDEPKLIRPTERESMDIEEAERAREKLRDPRFKKRPLPDDLVDSKGALVNSVALGEAALKALADRRKARHSHARSTCNSAKLSNMLTEAAPHRSVDVGKLNADPLALNCLSGTLHFEETEDPESDPDDPRLVWNVRRSDHDPDELITKRAEARFDPDDYPECPAFMTFLKQVQPEEEIRGFLKRFMGYSLLGITKEQCLIFNYGVGRNGKSTFVDLMCEILGDYAVTLAIESFSGDRSRGGSEATPDLARLPGSRFVAANEPEMGVKIKEGLVKTVTGGEPIPVRRLHEDFIEFHPAFKLCLSGNHKPRIDDTSDGIWRRVHLVPWDIQIPKEHVDKALPEKLRRERDGVFAWLVEGALDYLNFGLDVPETIRAATQEYREESDPIGQFINIALNVTGDPSDVAKPADLWISYQIFCNNESVRAFNQNTFNKRFAAASQLAWADADGILRQFEKGKSGSTVYRGLTIKPDYLPQSAGGNDWSGS